MLTDGAKQTQRYSLSLEVNVFCAHKPTNSFYGPSLPLIVLKAPQRHYRGPWDLLGFPKPPNYTLIHKKWYNSVLFFFLDRNWIDSISESIRSQDKKNFSSTIIALILTFNSVKKLFKIMKHVQETKCRHK